MAASPRPEWDIILSYTQKNNVEGIRQMVELGGVNPSHSNSVGQSGLHIAALWGHVEALETLLSLGADHGAVNRINGGTPLHLTAQSNKKPASNRIACARALIRVGADPTAVDGHGKVAADYADENDVPEDDPEGVSLKQILLDAMPGTQLFDAIDRGDLQALKDNVRLHFPSGIRDIKGSSSQSTPLLHAMNHRNLEAMEFLLKEGNADPNADDGDGVPTLKVAFEALMDEESSINASASAEEISKTLEFMDSAVRLLLDSGAEVDNGTKSLVHSASRKGLHRKSLVLIVDLLGVSVNFPGRQGLSPLHFAARSGRLNTARWLVERGANVRAVDDRGKTPLDAAVVNNHVDVADYLRSVMDPEEEPSSDAPMLSS